MFFFVCWSKHDQGLGLDAISLNRRLEAKRWPVRETLATPAGDLLSCFGIAGISRAVRDKGLLLAGDVRLDTLDGQVVDGDPFTALADGYRVLGQRLPGACVGDLALAIVDPSERRLMAIGDRLGIHPLYWQETSHAVLITNLPAAFSVAGAANDRLDREAIREFTLWSTPEDGATFLRGRKRLPPGHCLLADRQSGTVRIERYWHPDDVTVTFGLKDREVAEEGRRLVDQAVRRRLPASGCVGLEVSAGLDSSLVTALAARAGRERGLSFAPAAMVYPDWALAALASTQFPDADPREPVARMLAGLGMPPARFVDDVGADVVDRTRSSVRRLEAPWSLGRAKADLHDVFLDQGARVFLTGEGGNEAVSHGGGEVLAEHVGRRRYLAFVREAWLRLPRGRPRATTRAAETLLFIFQPKLARRLRRGRPKNDITSIFMRRALRRFAGSNASPEVFERQMAHGVEHAISPRFRSVHDSIAYALRREVNLRGLEGMYLDAADRGLDVRHPLLDADLVRFCLSLPGEHFSRDGYDRRLIRTLGEGLIPDDIRLHRGRTPHGLKVTRAQVWRERESVIAYLEQMGQRPAVTEFFDVEEMIAFLRAEEVLDLRREKIVDWAVLIVGLRMIAGLEEMG
ncbi:asparagine synthase-related protein [Novosphingobium beihaiensis]|uniref:asparagine synthase (glutamine-hydrolyzing) n=1 Tax=Novosphingobium beihaiensis TaxID=2930389 RepID=A0ABT0BPV5_9SPHN|nr:asparagine synthase-related protein [Novosphingobium beihaiensis]MCJ2187063.1 asparagine synthase-related protein [Novosphingobium beihaiensis]